MTSGQLVWSGDHFAPVELVQLRGDREQKALAWLDDVRRNKSGETTASLIVLVVPEDAFTPGRLLDMRQVSRLDPPLGYGDGPNGTDVEGRFFTSSMRPGRVRIFRNGVVEGVAWLNAHAIGPDHINLDAIHSNVEENVRAYLAMQQNALHLTGRSWLTLSLAGTDGLRASLTGTGQPSRPPLTESTISVPAVLVAVPVGHTVDAPVNEAVRQLFDVVASAFGL